jgi:hypothetical protein
MASYQEQIYKHLLVRDSALREEHGVPRECPRLRPVTGGTLD